MYLFHSITNLSISLSHRKEYFHSAKYLEEVENVFISSPKHAGAICYSKAMIAEHLGDYEGTRHNLYQSLSFFELTQEPIRIGRAELNIAHFEYRNRQYETSKEFIEKAIINLDGDPETKRIALKVYSKVLLKMGTRERALEMIANALKQFHGTEMSSLKAKFYILYSIANRDVKYAEKVLNDRGVSDSIRHLAYKHLKELCLQYGDADSLMKYARSERMLMVKKQDILDEEDL